MTQALRKHNASRALIGRRFVILVDNPTSYHQYADCQHLRGKAKEEKLLSTIKHQHPRIQPCRSCC